VILIASILVMAVGLGALIASGRSADDAASITTVGSRDLASLSAESSRSATASPIASTAPIVTESGSAEPPATALSVPIRVRIPRIGVNAPVLPVGLDEADAVAIPEDIMKVGWYELGVPPGASAGSAVLVAHRDGRVQGHGVFYDLGRLGVGDRIVVGTESGDRLTYRVVSRELISKKRLPLAELFAVDGPARLTLISCGGYYDRSNGGYQDNVVVTAVPVAATSN
jgi:LPXTG-site transpeptidase (sortase) family protein